MAELDVNQKTAIYHTLYLLNLSFSRIVAHCQTLHDAGVFKRKYTRLYQAYAQQLQAEINDEALDTVTSIEADDLHRFGKVRDARDKELRDPDDVFIHAEERRKAFSKKLDNLKAAIALHFGFYNFCRVHKTLLVTPAMEAGITDHVWTLAEMLHPF